jgi:hypothetical protein
MYLRYLLLLLSILVVPGLCVAADEEPRVWCGTFFEHMHGLMMQNEMIAGKYAERTDEERAEYKREMIQACVDAWEIPGEREIMACVLEAATFHDMQTCMAPATAQMQLRAKRAEAPAMLDGLRVAEQGHLATDDVYVACAPTPAEIPGADPAPFDGPGKADFDKVGASVIFDTVRCRYSVRLVDDDGTPVEDGFEALAECDIDGDGVIAVYRATASQGATRVTAEDVF